jgi:hypothetical protein
MHAQAAGDLSIRHAFALHAASPQPVCQAFRSSCAEDADGSDQKVENAREEPQRGNDLSRRAVYGVRKQPSEEANECNHGPDDDDRNIPSMLLHHVGFPLSAFVC